MVDRQTSKLLVTIEATSSQITCDVAAKAEGSASLTTQHVIAAGVESREL